MSTLDELGRMYGTDKSSEHHDYLKIYEQYIPRTGEGRLLELGWWAGDSMRMWRDWLYGGWEITGLDIEPKTPVPGVRFVRGDQTDERLLKSLGEFDVILDDASHLSPHTVRSLEILWPQVKPGGLYIVEDLQVSYHSGWQGYDVTSGRRRPLTTMEYLKQLCDAVHYGHSEAGPANPVVKDVAHVGFYPGVCLLRKKEA